MKTQIETAQIELQDVGSTSWWAGVLTTIASQYGTAHLRFVARVGGSVRYTGSTFLTQARPTPGTPLAPEVLRSLDDVCDELERDGWIRVGRGAEPWSWIYERLQAPVRS